ncbi:hypothetical protein [Paraliomyxa miuraensis]|uniref:hypothetical protein n=1 Tax=Paraliomyxa miuraensis TaxID=376150 RepID=UPI002255DDB3|nr:hypothetical protein [Paraliomyxa miuraensis]MCX4241108.1 hypothetical protein [Paraliomyxa miuraensis]
MLPCVVLGLLAVGLLVVPWPDAVARLAAKEGPLEHLGHGLLLVALVGWAVAAARARGADRRRERGLCMALVATCALVLGEELDWGAVYGVTAGAEALHTALGHQNLHNAWRGASYLLFSLPVVLLVGVVGWRRGDALGRLPQRRDALGLGLLGVASVVGAWGGPRWEPVLDEVVETILYLGLSWMALRPVGYPATSSKLTRQRVPMPSPRV